MRGRVADGTNERLGSETEKDSRGQHSEVEERGLRAAVVPEGMTNTTQEDTWFVRDYVLNPLFTKYGSMKNNSSKISEVWRHRTQRSQEFI